MPALTSAHPSCFSALIPKVDGVDPAALCSVTTGPAVGFNWFRPSYLHVTLCYLDWLNAPECRTAIRVVEDLAAQAPRELELTGELLVVGGPDRRSLIAPIQPETGLTGFREELAGRLRSAGLTVAEPFRPHLTVARVGPGPLAETEVRRWAIEPLRLPVRSVRLLEGRTVFRKPLPAVLTAPASNGEAP